MRKTSWFALAGLLAIAGCLGGCSNSRDDASASAAAVPVTTKNLVIVTWRPADKTAEFLSGWRAKE
ncbi:hypothetical protein [Variovorax sp. YR216]|uniref:hypothetical protein n=1 Tax=Variovorax sp. YR216 TaxID=1882828 RepID=UPI00115FA67E|nr:hypothetical protein [Variovorax sp. YR216]